MDVCEQVPTRVTQEELVAEIHKSATRVIIWYAAMMTVHTLVTISSFAFFLWLFT